MLQFDTLPDVAIMGILNVTPDSFSDGGLFIAEDTAVRHAEQMVEDGADIIDVGGESTRPGSDPVSLDLELSRVIPVIERLRSLFDVPISIDTTKPEVMRAGVAAGAKMINDVRALQAPGALEAAADAGCPVCLMHMQGAPRSMQTAPEYDDVVGDVMAFLEQRVSACLAAGIPKERIAVDPGYGFGKTANQNLELLRRQGELVSLGCRILAGFSRKTTLGVVTGRKVDDRMPASIVAAVIAVQNGASIVRVHDVAETRDALRLLHAVRDGVSE